MCVDPEAPDEPIIYILIYSMLLEETLVNVMPPRAPPSPSPGYLWAAFSFI